MEFRRARFLGICEALATFTPNRIVTDARLIQDYYRRRFGKDSTMIGYGAEVPLAPIAWKVSICRPESSSSTSAASSPKIIPNW